MGSAADLCLPADWATSVPEVLTAAGFTVSTRGRAGVAGHALVEHVCVRDGKTVSFTETTGPGDAACRHVLGIAGGGGTLTLKEGLDALLQKGALDADAYKQRQRGAGG